MNHSACVKLQGRVCNVMIDLLAWTSSKLCYRYLSDMPLPRDDGLVLQEGARNDAVEYYLKAQSLDASLGLTYNQLGAIIEQKDSGADSVCLGACMHFAIAATSQIPARSGISNFRRSIGIHRNALQAYRNQHTVAFPETPTGKCATQSLSAIGFAWTSRVAVV